MVVIVFVSTKDIRFEDYIACGLFEFLPWPNPIWLSESQGQRSIAVKVGDNGQRSNLLHIQVHVGLHMQILVTSHCQLNFGHFL